MIISRGAYSRVAVIGGGDKGLKRSLRSPGTVYGQPGAMTVERRENFQFKIQTTKQRTVKNIYLDEVRNSLVISFAESSITEKEFPISNEEFESEE